MEHEVPEPVREPLHTGQRFWIANPFYGPQEFTWEGSKDDLHAMNSGLVHLTEEASEKHCKAIKSLMVKQHRVSLRNTIKTCTPELLVCSLSRTK